MFPGIFTTRMSMANTVSTLTSELVEKLLVLVSHFAIINAYGILTTWTHTNARRRRKEFLGRGINVGEGGREI